MSRIFSVFAVFVLQFGLISSSAFALNYHVDSKNTRPNDASNQYYSFFYTTDPTERQKILPTTFASADVQDVNLILHNDDGTALNDMYGSNGSGPRYITSTLTVRSDDPNVQRNLSSSDKIVNDSRGTPIPYARTTLFEINNLSGVLNIDKSITFSNSSSPNPSGTWGAVINNVIGTLNAEGVVFSNNDVRGSVIEGSTTTSYYYYTYGIGSINYLNGATFTLNTAGDDAGAVDMRNYSYLEANNATFSLNRSNYEGGALFAADSWIVAESAKFSENLAGANGGAVFARNSYLDLKGADFLGNKAQGAGGAIYFAVNDSGSHELVLGAHEGTTASFLQNEDYYGVNSIVFAGVGSALVHVDVERYGCLNMNDPMRVQANSGLSIVIDKTGEGIWTLGGANNLHVAASGTQIDIREGTFQLDNGSVLNLTHTLGLDSLSFQSGSVFMVGDAALSGAASSVSTTKLFLASNSTMRLNNALILYLSGDDSIIGSTLSGSGNLTKEGVGALAFTGTTDKYAGNVNLNAGTFAIGAGKQFETTGKFSVNPNTTLSIVVDDQRPTIVAGQVDLSGAKIEITGISGKSNADFVIVKSGNSIIHTTDPTPVFDGSTTMPNYLRTAFGFRDANGVRDAEYAGTVGLTWYADDGTEHGTFTLQNTNSKFTVNTVLDDVKSKSTWDGKSLTKDGAGTLELSEDNGYTGETTVKGGTLLLTHFNGTGNGKSAVVVNAPGTLALDFQFGNETDYDRQITGDGKVVKQGDSTVKLTNIANDYKGGTEIREGILQFDDGKVFGSAPNVPYTVSFSGGTLQNTSQTTLTQAVSVGKNHYARFDTPVDLTVSGGISGVGGLTKTGVGTLTLSGTNPYEGETRFEEGAVEISRWDNIGKGRLVFDGGSFLNTGIDVTLSNNVSLESGHSGIITGSAGSGLTLSGTISGEGTLVKNGDASSTLTLNGVNDYSGGTLINAGTLEIARKESLGTGTVTFAGGTLRNTQEILGLSQNIMINPGVQAAFEVAGNEMNVASKIVGSGGLTKTGDAMLTLSGNSTYSGKTVVSEGVLAVDGRIQSFVEVEKGAALGGTGTIGRDVNFQDGSAYRWNFNRTEANSPYLHIAGDVYLKNTYFQAVTAGDVATYPSSIDGWTVLAYDGSLLGDGRFIVDDSYCPFVDIALNYDTNGQVKIVAHNRHDPRPLSDIMAASLMIAQRKVYRRAFEQVDNELRHGRYIGSEPLQFRRQQSAGTTRGQARGVSKNLWGNMTGRTSNFASTYYTDDQWKLNSFGVQAGYSFLSTNWISLGVTAGAEFPQLKNGYDKIDASDGYLGLYYGQRVFGMWEVKGYLGGGLQSYKMHRRDALYTYQSKYHGDSFETNLEFARPFLLGDWMLRPYVGFDLEYASQAGSVESESSAEFRSYSGTSLTQMFLRVGMDFEKRLERGDFIFGIGYANMIGGQSMPQVYVYYPFAKKGVTSYGAEMGHSVVSLSLGGNRYLNASRTKALFLDYTAEIFCDRDGGASQHNFAFGYSYRF